MRRLPEMSIEVHRWEDGAHTVITRNGYGVKVHVANYDTRHAVANHTVCVHDDKGRLIEYVKYLEDGEVDHYATYRYEGHNSHESSMTVFDKQKRPIYSKRYKLNEGGRPTRADYFDPQGRLKSYEEYVYEQDRCSTVQFFNSVGHPIDSPIAE